jgi:RNA polymerase sigma-70 factor (ECF subfamily)
MTCPDLAANQDFEAEIRKHHALGDYRRAANLGLSKYGPELLRFASAMMKHRTLAEEAFGEACEKIWIALPEFRFDCSFRSWTFLIVRRLCIEHLRDPNLKRMRPLSAAGPLSAIVDEVRTQTAEYLQDEAKGGLRLLRESLSPEEQALLTLRLDRGLSWAEVADVVNDEGTVDDKGRKQLEASLRKQFERLKIRLKELARREGLLTSKNQ